MKIETIESLTDSSETTIISHFAHCEIDIDVVVADMSADYSLAVVAEMIEYSSAVDSAVLTYHDES